MTSFGGIFYEDSIPGFGPEGNVTALTSSPSLIGSLRAVHVHQQAKHSRKITERADRQNHRGRNTQRTPGAKTTGKTGVIEEGKT